MPDPDTFLETLDGMIEATHEFIGDDVVTQENDPEHRLVDLKCLEYVRTLYIEVYKLAEEDD